MSENIHPLDEKRAQYKRQMKRMCEDPVGLEVIGESLGLQVKRVDGPQGDFAVAVLVPSYDGLHPKMMDSSTAMIRYAQKFFSVFSEPVQGSSIISWTRNDMYTRLSKGGKPFTHVCWLDDDMVFEQDHLVRMIERQQDIVGSVYTTRTEQPTVVPNIHLVEIDTCRAWRIVNPKFRQKGVLFENGLISAKDHPSFTLTAGTGFLLVRKQVMDAVANLYVTCGYEKLMWNLTDEQTAFARKKRLQNYQETGAGYWFQLLPRLDGWGESGEDSSFCIKAAMCGYKVHIDTTIQPGHMGEYGFSFSDYLPQAEVEVAKARARGLYQEEEIESEVAV